MRRLLLVTSICAALCFCLRVEAQAPAAPPQEITLAEYEQLIATEVGGKPNPGVLKMTAAQYYETVGRLHPAFQSSPQIAKAAVKYGASRKAKSLETLTDRWNRESGGDKAFALTEIVHFAYLGWENGRTYKEVDPAVLDQVEPSHYVPFFISVSRSTAKEVENLRFVLETDDGKHYQPVAEPATSEVTSTTKNSTFSVPQVQTTRERGTLSSGGRSAYYNGKTTNTYWRTFTRSKTSYQGSFEVTFDLLNPDGSPRILATAKSCTLVVIGDGRERRINFKLADWLVPEEGSKKK